jgi:hypothetical protein
LFIKKKIEKIKLQHPFSLLKNSALEQHSHYTTYLKEKKTAIIFKLNTMITNRSKTIYLLLEVYRTVDLPWFSCVYIFFNKEPNGKSSVLLSLYIHRNRRVNVAPQLDASSHVIPGIHLSFFYIYIFFIFYLKVY